MANFNFNKCIIGGRLTAPVELKQTPNGVTVCTFTVAVNRKANREVTDFINCVAWRNTAEFVARFFDKGSSICVTGEIQTRNWTDTNGNKRYTTELIADEVCFVDGKNDRSDTAAVQNTASSYTPTIATSAEEFTSDEDLPF